MESHNSNVTSDYNYDYSDYESFYNDYFYFYYIMYVITCIIISIGLPLTLVAIYSLYSQVKNDHVAPIFIINLLISDIFQLCIMIVEVVVPRDWRTFFYFYRFGLVTSVGFMVCIALERYLLIAWPLWYHFRRTIKISLVVCVVVWTLPLVYFFISIFWADWVMDTIFAIFLLIPFPLLIFFLGGTLKALSAAISVSSDEKRRIVGMLVLVLLIYTLLFLPMIMMSFRVRPIYNYKFYFLTYMFLKFSPLADLILYVFMRKGVIDKLLASLCCCRMDSDDNSRSSP